MGIGTTACGRSFGSAPGLCSALLKTCPGSRPAWATLLLRHCTVGTDSENEGPEHQLYRAADYLPAGFLRSILAGAMHTQERLHPVFPHALGKGCPVLPLRGR